MNCDSLLYADYYQDRFRARRFQRSLRSARAIVRYLGPSPTPRHTRRTSAQVLRGNQPANDTCDRCERQGVCYVGALWLCDWCAASEEEEALDRGYAWEYDPIALL